MLDRRRFLGLVTRGVPATLLAPTATYAIGIEPTWIEVQRHRITLPHLAPGLDGLRVVQISDIHRSDLVSHAYVDRALREVLALEPELIALTGDFITSDPLYFDLVCEQLAPLAQAAPCFAVTGNHDFDHWYPHAAPGLPDGGRRLGDALARTGIQLLRNASVIARPRGAAGRIELVGVDDLWSDHFDPTVAFASACTDVLPRLVLCHNPDGYRVLEHERFDLMLAGHTHGGQVRLPLIGVPYSPVEDKRFVTGLVDTGRHLVYTNRGLGFNRRIRFGARPEITLFTLVRTA